MSSGSTWRVFVQEFELISHESEYMKRRLLSQEDEFRLQNETLMTELGQVGCWPIYRVTLAIY